MDDLKERIVVKAKEFRLDSFDTQKNSPKLKELFTMSESELRKIDMSEFLNLSSDNLGTSQGIIQDLFELIDELIVRDGGSLPE
jgi:hypothetical protein